MFQTLLISQEEMSAMEVVKASLGSFYPIPRHLPSHPLCPLPSTRSRLFAADQGSASRANLQDSEFHSYAALARVHYLGTGLICKAQCLVAFSSPPQA